MKQWPDPFECVAQKGGRKTSYRVSDPERDHEDAKYDGRRHYFRSIHSTRDITHTRTDRKTGSYAAKLTTRTELARHKQL